MNGRRVAGWCVGLLGVFLVAGCGADAPTIDIVYGDPGSTRLEVSVNTCNRNPSVDAEESSERVRLTVTADEPSGNGEEDCMDGAVLILGSPLGDRIVVDESTDEQVEVAPLED